jgi:N4-(beta-N-acetylglucosaminyl)-L-asparaginase
MANRRKFVKQLILGTGGVLLGLKGNANTKRRLEWKKSQATVLSTWNHGLAANKKAYAMLLNGVNALDAVEAGVSVTESDLSNRSVGLGGRPDRLGHVTLDACIMNHLHQCGAVAYIQHIDHPIQVARKVMELTPHVLIVGDGAYDFALENGFSRSVVEVPQPKVKLQYEKWLEKEHQSTPVNIENHDTIGMIAIDQHQNLSGACTTSGLAYKMHGRVGDSPIIGAGLFVDNEVGAAVATGVGEMVIRTAGTHTVVELMRAGASPEEACKDAVARIIKWHPELEGKQVGYLAINKEGKSGAFAIRKGFSYAKAIDETNKMHQSPSFY